MLRRITRNLHRIEPKYCLSRNYYLLDNSFSKPKMYQMFVFFPGTSVTNTGEAISSHTEILLIKMTDIQVHNFYFTIPL